MYEFLYQLNKSQLNDLFNCTNDDNLKTAILKVLHNKDDIEFTEYQSIFINGLAFGTTKEKLEKNDYTDLLRIIYLPKNKVYQMTHK